MSRLPAPPLYDGIVVLEPYQWLDPPPDHPGGAQGANATVAVEDGLSDQLAVAVPGSPPQLQLIASSGALTILPTTTSISVSIEPVHSRPAPAGSYIDGNSYRVDVVDQDGNAITAPASAYVSLILRPADPGLMDATIERFDGRRWQPLETDSAGAAGFFTVVTQFGEFALVAAGVSPYPTLSPAPAGASPTSAGPEPSPTVSPPAGAPPGGPASVLLAVAFGAALVIVLVARLRRRPPRGVRSGWER